MKSTRKQAAWLAALMVVCTPNAWGVIPNGTVVTISRPTENDLGGAGDNRYHENDKACGDGLLAGESRIDGGGERFKTFSLEVREHLSIPQRYLATIDQGAMAGGQGLKHPGPRGLEMDPLCNATRWFYSAYRNNTLAGQGGFAYDDPTWADALQLVFWRLEEEIKDDGTWQVASTGELPAGCSDAMIARAEQLWAYYLAHRGGPTGIDTLADPNVKVLNLWKTTGAIYEAPGIKSQLYYEVKSAPQGGAAGGIESLASFDLADGPWQNAGAFYQTPGSPGPGYFDPRELTPTPGTDGSGPGDLPEPATIVIWGVGLAIAGLIRLVRRSRTAA